MGDGEPQGGDWLPPRAPGAEPPPSFDTAPDPLAVPPPPPPPPAPAPAPAQYARPPRNDEAVIALACGIGGLVLFVLSGFGLVFILNLPCSILAWAFGIRARRKVDRGETAERRGMAQAAIVLGVVGTVLGVLAIIGWAIAIATSEEVRDELRKQLEESGNS